jgi:hypothetical protein
MGYTRNKAASVNVGVVIFGISSLRPAKYTVSRLQDQKRDPDDEQWPIVDKVLRHWTAFRSSEWRKLRPVF